MSQKIHDNISRALSKRKHKVPMTIKDLEAFEQSPQHVKTTPLPFEERLDKIISKKPIEIDLELLAKQYKQKFNQAISKLKGNELESQQQIHQEVIEQMALENAAFIESQTLQEICDKARDEELKIQQLCSDIANYRQKLLALQEALKLIKIPESMQLQAMITRKIHDTNFKKAESIFDKVVSQGVYCDDEQDVIQAILLYLKNLVLISPNEYGQFLTIKLQRAIDNPFTIEYIQQIADSLSKVLQFLSIQAQEIAESIHHILTYLLTLITVNTQNELLATLHFSKIEDLQKNQDHKLAKSLLNFQELLNALGKNRLLLLNKKDDTATLIQTQLLFHKAMQLNTAFRKTKNNIKSTTLSNINQILKSFSKDYARHNILLFKLTRGDYFNQASVDTLQSATYSFHDIFNVNKLMNLLIENVQKYSFEQKECCLIFLKHFISLDTQHTFIPIKRKKNQFIAKIELLFEFMEINKNQILMSLAEEINLLIDEKRDAKENAYSQYINSITKGRLPKSHLIRRLNSINIEFTKNTTSVEQMEEYIIEVNFILDSPTLSDLISTQPENLKSAVDKFCNLLQGSLFAHFAKEIKSKLDERLDNPTEQPFLELETPMDEKPFKLKKLLHEIVLGKSMVIENEKLLNSFFNAVKSGFAKRLTMIDLSELRELAWKQDTTLMQNNLMPIALNSRVYYQYFNAIVQFFTLAILCTIETDDEHIEPRSSLYEIKNILEFIEKAILRAIDNGAIATAIAFNTVLESPPIKRLGLGNNERETLRKSRLANKIASHQTLTHTIFVQDVLPYLGTVQAQIENEYLRKTEGEFEKRVFIGNILRAFEDKKNSVKEGLVKNDLIHQIMHFLTMNDLLLAPLLKDDILIDEQKIANIALKISNELKPNSFKDYNISKFKTLKEMHDVILYWHQRMEDFHFTGKQPEKQIYEAIVDRIAHDNVLSDFKESLSILNLIEHIDKSKNRSYKNYEHDLYLILKSYYGKITELIHDNEPNDIIENFFLTFNNDTKIQSYQQEIAKSAISHIPFTSSQNLKEIIELINQAQIQYKKSIEMFKKSRDQQIYSELLTKVLEGDHDKPIINFGSIEDQSQHTAVSLLPETEFPVPQAEPEHPDYIGINRTMNFNPSAKYRSTLALFKTEELIKDFTQAFPWSVELNSLHILENAKHSRGCNLLLLDEVVEPKIQLSAMKLILLSLDCLGILSGVNGEFAIQNFDKIKMVADTLNGVAQVLIAAWQNPIVETKLDHAIFKLMALSKELQFMQTQSNPTYPVQSNDLMNEFCHINEYLCYKLLGIPQQKTVLSPIDNKAGIFKIISNKVKEEIIRFHS
ncbi:MAG: hypothetical protein JSS07_07560 [Proteobacteria bacterium]|nr:hypothetical protein [Pseudomonadota bacterium]